MIEHFSPLKKMLQKLGSWAVRVASNTNIPDAPSGFRAITRSAAQRIAVFNDYTYTLETIIQAGQKHVAITSVPVRVPKTCGRRTRLQIPSYIARSVVTIVRVFVIYRPFRFFAALAAVSFLAGFAIGFRFLLFYLAGEGDGHVQSLMLATLLMGAGFQFFVVAFVADHGRQPQAAGGPALPHAVWRQAVDSRLAAGPESVMKISGGRMESGVVYGNTYDKYGSANPLVRRIMRGFTRRLEHYVDRAAPASIHEVGCGEGYWTLRWVRRGVALPRHRLCGCRHRSRARQCARRRSRPRHDGDHGGRPRSRCAASTTSLRPTTGRLDRLLRGARAPARPAHRAGPAAAVAGRHVILSVPREPLWHPR